MADSPAGSPSDRGPCATTSRGIVCLAVLLLAVQVGPLHYPHGDAGGYISIARNLAHGEGLMNRDTRVLWYPPGYPLLICPLFLLGDLPLPAISIFHFLLALALMSGLYLWARRIAPAGAIWMAVIPAGTAAFCAFYRRPVSETAFMTASIWAIVCLERAIAEKRIFRCAAWAAAAALLFGAGALVRSIGITLAGGVAVRLGLAAWNRRIAWPRAACLALPAVLLPIATVAVATLRDTTIARSLGEDSYVTVIAEQTNPLLAGWHVLPWCSVVVNEIGRVSLPGMWASYPAVGQWWDVNMLIYVPLCALLIAGWVRCVRRVDDVFAWTLPFYLALLTYCRFESGARYWAPMTPILIVCLWFLLEPLGLRRQKFFAVFWVCHVLAACAFWLGRDLPSALALRACWPEAKAAAARIDRDRNRVTVAEDLNKLGYVLELELDRRVAEWPRAASQPPANTRWLILPAGAAAPPGYALQARLDRSVLWRSE